jgi:hypothetical protein
MTELFSRNRRCCASSTANALASPKLKIINADALQWLEASQEIFDFVVADFPDPSNHSLGKLYSTAFYRLLKQHVADTGRVVVQATSPLYARESFWTVVATLEAAGWQTAPYHALVPSFGEWGFILAGRREYRPPHDHPGADALRHARRPARAVPLPRRHGARRRRTQPPRQPEPGAHLRARVGQGAGAVNQLLQPTSRNPAMSVQTAFFETQALRRIYDEETETWWFSVVDIMQVLTQQPDYQTARKYWNKLKERLGKEGSQSVTNCHRLKLPAADGKNYLTD